MTKNKQKKPKKTEKNRKEQKRTKKNRKKNNNQQEPKSDDYPNQLANLDNFETVLRLSKLAS